MDTLTAPPAHRPARPAPPTWAQSLGAVITAVATVAAVLTGLAAVTGQPQPTTALALATAGVLGAGWVLDYLTGGTRYAPPRYRRT